MRYEVKYKPRELEKDLGAPLEFLLYTKKESKYFRKFFEALDYVENTINSLGDEKNKRLNKELGYKIVDELIPEERLAGSKTAKEICENLDISYLRFRYYTDPGYRRKNRRKNTERKREKREFEKNMKTFFKRMDKISESVSFAYSEEGRNLNRELLQRKKRVEKIAKSGLLDKFSHEGGANLENVAEEYGMTVYQVLKIIGDCMKMGVISSEKIKIK